MTTYEILWLRVPSSARRGARAPAHMGPGVETETNANVATQKRRQVWAALHRSQPSIYAKHSGTKSTASSRNSDAGVLLTVDQHK